jgi:hypothetical protein
MRPIHRRLTLAHLLIGLTFAPSLVGAQMPGQEEAERVVVMVRARFDAEEQWGAGLVVGARAGRLYVVTANHVVRRGATVANVTVSLRTLPGEWHPARVLDHADRQLDVAMLALIGQPGQPLAGDPFPSAILGSPETLKVGDDLRAIGNPLGSAWHVNLSPFKYRKTDGDRFSFEAPLVQKGHSGGGVFDPGWRLIGMLIRDEPPDGVAISISRLVAQVKDWGYPMDLVKAMARPPAASALPTGSTPPSPPPPRAPTTVPQPWVTSRSYLADEQYPCPRGTRCYFMVRLLNVETDAEQKWLRFNFIAESMGNVDVYLDSPAQTTFLMDQKGRQHILADARGLNAETPVRIPAGGSSRFTLIFPLASDMGSFRYEATLAYRCRPPGCGRPLDHLERVRIKRDVPVSLAEFR